MMKPALLNGHSGIPAIAEDIMVNPGYFAV
jgi:hypothetical protein